MSLKLGRVVKLFVLADLALLAGWGLLAPIFSLFIINRVEGATVVSVGIASAVYWFVKGTVQIPIANYLDKSKNEKDDYVVLVLGLVMASLTAFSYVFIQHLWQLYLLEAAHAIAFAMYSPSWLGIFSRHLDKNHHGLDFAMDNAAVSFASAITGFCSGLVVKFFGFPALFVAAGSFTLVSAFIVLTVPSIIFPKQKTRLVELLKNHKMLK